MRVLWGYCGGIVGILWWYCEGIVVYSGHCGGKILYAHITSSRTSLILIANLL